MKYTRAKKSPKDAKQTHPHTPPTVPTHRVAGRTLVQTHTCTRTLHEQGKAMCIWRGKLQTANPGAGALTPEGGKAEPTHEDVGGDTSCTHSHSVPASKHTLNTHMHTRTGRHQQEDTETKSVG